MNLVNALLQKATAIGSPISGTFELTGRCNLSCKMCYIHDRTCDPDIKNRELTTAQWFRLARHAADAGTLMLLLTGGEPMLRPDFGEIYRFCAEQGFLITINTNATLLTPALLELFTEHPPLRLNASVYAMSAEGYARLCGNGEVFRRVTDNLRALRQRGLPVQINFTATPMNQGDFKAVKAFADEIGATLQFAAYTFPPVRRPEPCAADFRRFTPQEAAEASVEYMLATHPLETLRASATELPLRSDDCGENAAGFRCRAGRASYWITYDGFMQPCGMLPGIRTAVAPSCFAAAWNFIAESIAGLNMPPACVACPDSPRCEVCPAICYGENGNLTDVPTYICQKNTHYRQRLRELTEEGSDPYCV